MRTILLSLPEQMGIVLIPVAGGGFEQVRHVHEFLLRKAHQRGVLNVIDYDFNATTDTAGKPWTGSSLQGVSFEVGAVMDDDVRIFHAMKARRKYVEEIQRRR